MSRKNMGSSIEEAQNQAIKGVVAWQLSRAMKGKGNLEGPDGNEAEDQPYTGRQAPGCEERHSVVELGTAAAAVGRRFLIRLV